jgi:ketosteroid isomerase-like protein
MKHRLLALLLLLPLLAHAQEDPARTELRRVGEGVLAALKQGDLEAQLASLHPNVVVTWPDAEVSRGTAAVRGYLQRIKSGAHERVQ